MRSFITVLFAVTAGALSVGACSSDETSGATGGMCKGSYAALTQAELDAQLDPAGNCANSKDSAIECSNDVTTLAEECGADCFKNEDPADAKQDACVKDCLSTSTTPSLSAACTECYIADVGCARDHCLIKCGTAPTSEACYQCRVDNGCVAAFFPCSGLPNERAVPSGGAGAPGDVDVSAAGAGGGGGTVVDVSAAGASGAAVQAATAGAAAS
ncbi:MAG: hypothetical protein ABJB12_14655 [Pseudomonadota bacterium]